MSHVQPSRFLYVVAFALLVAACRPAPEAYVSTLGVDTVTVEVFNRTSQGIEGVLVERTPFTQVTRYSAALTPEGRISRLSAERSTPDGNPQGPEPVTWSVEIEDGRATIERSGGDDAGTAEMDVSGYAIPSLGRASAAMFVFDQVARHLKSDDAEAPIQLIGPGATTPSTNNARLVSADTVSMDFFGSPRVAWLDESGSINGASGAATTLKVETRRVDAVDPDALAARWAALDARGEGIGTPSIPGDVSAEVEGASIRVVYSRPAKRGRTIWGGLVPYGEVWRTGANAATHFVTDRTLVFGDFELPAGTYTVFSRFDEDGQVLIVNEQTQQWGTQHDPARDLVRIPLTESALADPAELFTIAIDETETGGRLSLNWDRSSYHVDFVVQ